MGERTLAVKRDAAIYLREEYCAIDTGEGRYAALKDAPIKSSEEESAVVMAQREKLAVMKDAQIKSREEVSAVRTGRRGLAATKAAPIQSSMEGSAFGMGQRSKSL